MVWSLLAAAFRLVGRLLLPQPKGLPASRIDLKAPCPVCGNVGSKLRAERVAEMGREPNEHSLGKVMVGVTCDTCQFKHYLEPISVPKHPGM